MALPAAFSLLHSELNDFLFAQMGEEENGSPLSVLSALTRLGVDPWAEGARLSDLPRDAAARALVPMIAKFPKERRVTSEVLAQADRLAWLLPRRPGHAAGTEERPDGPRRPVLGRWMDRLMQSVDDLRSPARILKLTWIVLAIGAAIVAAWLAR